ncbi:MAG: glycoside hydrolase family 32 protein [Chloroflexi bacterium]|nr:glycoside hydrolase family 32 protein [Chloroflexota bacterium]
MTTSDRASRAPRYTFADTLDAQEAQLRDNPLVRRMAASRQALAGDPHRPLYHFVSPENRLNDPNGLCFWQGRWHLFYQGYPPEDPRPHWGHAVSDDLIHWRDLPYAIYPDPEESCFSGGTLVEDDRVIAIFHGTQVGNMVAVSSDPLLLNWEKVTGQAVIPIPDHDGSPREYTVYDPCIWQRDGVYYSLSGGALTDGPGDQRIAADFLFRSHDLETWEYLHPLTEGDRFTLAGDDGACPYFWPIGDRHMLLFFSHMSGGQYLLGDYDEDRDKLVVTSHGLFNFGATVPSGVHAPSATPDGQGGIIVLFNMNPGYPTAGWNQIMTLPRRLTLAGDDDVRVEPAGDIESLRHDHRHVGPTELPANEEVVLAGIEGSALELAIELDPGAAPMVELNVLRSPGREEYTRIAFYMDRGFKVQNPSVQPGAVHHTGQVAIRGYKSPRPVDRYESLLTLDSSYASTLPGALSRAPETALIRLDPDEPLRLRVFVDRSVVEVFANGKQCVAVRVYPGRGDSTGVSLRAQGSPAHLRSLDAWQMRSIYPQH